MVRNADVAAAMGMEPHLVRRWRESNEEGLTLQALASDRAGGISAMAKFVRLILQIAMLGVGAYLVTQNQLTGGGMIAGSIILSRAMAPIEQSIGAWRGMVGAKGAFESIKSLLGRTPATGEAMSLPKARWSHISIEGVAFVSPGAQEPILRGVTCEILPGDTVGLIGPSASGKTIAGARDGRQLATDCRPCPARWRGRVRLGRSGSRSIYRLHATGRRAV